MAKLTMKKRKRLKKKQFAIPSKAPRSGSYPINDPNHARNALARVSQHGTPQEMAEVRAAVHRKYPEMGQAHKQMVGRARPTPLRRLFPR